MVLGFKKKFADGTPTEFLEKIIAGVDPLGFLEDEQIKLHSIRAGNRWKAGMSIQMAYGVRTSNYHQFNQHHKQLQTCVSVQSIEMDYNLHDNTIGMKIDGRIVDKYIIRQVIKNDGLLRHQFIDWFFKDSNSFSGQIIHWTDLTYNPAAPKKKEPAVVGNLGEHLNKIYNSIKKHR
jgi:hypothetical protein